MRGRLFWILILGIAFALLILAARHNGGAGTGLSGNDIGSLAYYLILIVFVGGSLIIMFRRQFAQAIRYALIWVAIGLVLIVGYTYRAELRDVSERVMAELMPGRAVSRGPRTVEIVRGPRLDRKSTRLNSSHYSPSRMPSSA